MGPMVEAPFQHEFGRTSAEAEGRLYDSYGAVPPEA
jgi:hypothetical protein